MKALISCFFLWSLLVSVQAMTDRSVVAVVAAVLAWAVTLMFVVIQRRVSRRDA